MINAAFLFDKYNDNKVFGEKNRDFFPDQMFDLCYTNEKSWQKNQSQLRASAFLNTP